MLQHFINVGTSQGRQGIASFDPVSYRNAYPDLRAAFGIDWEKYYTHFMTSGVFEGRVGTGFSDYMVGGQTTYEGIDYAAVFNPGYYAAHNQDIFAAYGFNEDKLFEHFVLSGMAEGRRANPEFDVNAYMTHHPDLQAAFGADLKSYYMHYVTYGQAEGRTAVN